MRPRRFPAHVWLAVAGGLLAASAPAQLPIAFTSAVETRPAVAQNTQTGDFLVAYLNDATGTPQVRFRRVDSNGQPLSGELAPLVSIPHQPLGPPALAYSPVTGMFFFAVPARINGEDGLHFGWLSGDGASEVHVNASLVPNSVYYPGNLGDGAGSVRIAYNSIIDEFVATLQVAYWSTDCLPSNDPCHNSVWATRGTLTLLDNGYAVVVIAPVLLAEFGRNGFHTHAIAYAPVADLAIPSDSGRYLFAAGFTELKMLASDLQPMYTLWNQGAPSFPLVPLNYGAPEGNYDDLDIALGTVDGRLRFLVVWSDSDNCRPPLSACPDPADQWTGIWGTYVDPLRVRYDATSGAQDNTPFPISRIWSHLGTSRLSTPRVAFDGSSGAFVVSWREIPFVHEDNDESRSHIRSATVDYDVPDGLYETGPVPLPHPNHVLSPVTGTCAPGTPCYSAENPILPAVAGSWTGGRPLAVWQQTWVPNPSDQDIRGNLVCTGIFCDGFESGSTSAWSVSLP